MNMDEFLGHIAKALDVDVDRISMNTTQEEVEEWDSLGHLSILQQLDSATGEKIDQVSGLGSVTSVKELWERLTDAGLAKN